MPGRITGGASELKPNEIAAFRKTPRPIFSDPTVERLVPKTLFYADFPHGKETHPRPYFAKKATKGKPLQGGEVQKSARFIVHNSRFIMLISD
jgi:hypothetical protein